MTELETVLRRHAGRYPLTAPQDAVKLLYQNEFGGGHLIADRAGALLRLRRELEPLGQTEEPLWEAVGNGVVRVRLRALTAHGLSAEGLFDWFCASAEALRGTRAGFLEKLAVLEALTEQGVFAFSPEALGRFLEGYGARGYPPVSHSDAYRAAYRPAYRVALERLAPRLPE